MRRRIRDDRFRDGIKKAYFGSWAGALKPVRVVSAPRAAPMPGSAPGISGAESGLAPGPPPEADGDMHRDPFRLLEAALRRSSGARQRLGRASFTHAATTGMREPGVEPWCELHARGGYGHSRFTRWTSKLPSACCRGESPRPLQRSRVQWRARGYQGHQVVALAHSDQGCALVGLCLSMCEVGVRAGGVCG